MWGSPGRPGTCPGSAPDGDRGGRLRAGERARRRRGRRHTGTRRALHGRRAGRPGPRGRGDRRRAAEAVARRDTHGPAVRRGPWRPVGFSPSRGTRRCRSCGVRSSFAPRSPRTTPRTSRWPKRSTATPHGRRSALGGSRRPVPRPRAPLTGALRRARPARRRARGTSVHGPGAGDPGPVDRANLTRRQIRGVAVGNLRGPWTCATVPRTRPFAPRSAPGWPSTWWASTRRSAAGAARGTRPSGFEVRLRWERELAAGGWTCVGWPAEHGGRGASLAQQVIFNEEYVRARAPGRVGVVGEGLLGPTLIQYGTDAQQDRFLPPDPPGHGAVVPGLLGARRRQRPGQRGRPGPSSTGTSGWSPARRSGRRSPTRPTGASSCAAPSPAPPATAAFPTCWCPWTSPAWRSGPSSSSPGPPSSTRCSSTAPAPTGRTWWASPATAGGWPWPRWPSSGAWRCSATSSPSAASWTAWWRWRVTRGVAGAPVLRQRLAAAYAELEIMR